MIKGIVFDLDDTLISELDYIKSGYRVVSNVMSRDYKLNSKKIYETMLSEFYNSPKKVFNRILEKYNINYDDMYIKKLVKIYRNHIPSIAVYNDVIPAIAILKGQGYKLGIITDGYKESQRKKLDIIGISKYFDYIILTDELGREYWKPSEKSFELMAEKLGLNYNELIYLGDNEEKDFIAPNKLGMTTIKINRENKIYDKVSNNYLDKPQFIITSLLRNTLRG